MAIYRGKGGATEVEPAPGDTEFAGSLIVSGDILDRGNLVVEEDLLTKGTITSDGAITSGGTITANGTITSEEGFIGDGSGLTNVPNVWTQDGGAITEFAGDGSEDTQLWIVNGEKQAKIIQNTDGSSYFKGDGPTYFGTDSDGPVNIQVQGTNQLAIGKENIYAFLPVTAPSFIGDGSQLTGLPPTGIPDAPVDGVQYGRQNAEWTQIAGDGVWSVSQETGDAVYDGTIDVQSVESYNDITIGPIGINPGFGMTVGYGSGGSIDSEGRPRPIISNVAIGNDTLVGGSNPDTVNAGQNIVAIGYGALRANLGGSSNTAVGYTALKANTNGQDNTAVGVNASLKNTLGTDNTSVGKSSLLENSTGDFNTAIGQEALYGNVGDSNTALGHRAGVNITSGTNNTVLGQNARASSNIVSNEVTLGNADVTTVRVGNGDVIYPAPAPDSYTKTESDTINNAQDVKIQDNANAIATLPNTDDFYTKGEIDLQQGAQDNLIIFNNDEINRQQIEITNNSASIDKNDGDINSNTTAIGTLSGQVAQNTEDIAELQNSIFFTSAYSAEYPSAPNRDPEDGNMYLQNVALFTYSFAAATQIFVSKTDESGNVRQFTAVQPGDSIVLNEVNSPNYGRYELVTIEEVSESYVVMNVIPKLGQGTVISGAKIAFQAFPKVGLWDENESNGYGVYPNNIEINGGVDIGSAANGKLSNTMLGRNASGQNAGASAINNVSVGDNAFAKMSGAKDSVAVGSQAMKSMVSGSNNTAVGSRALSLNPNGKSNVAIGAYAGATLAGGDNNILIGDNAAPSAPTVNNEITLGNEDTTVLRMGNGDVIYPNSPSQSAVTMSAGITATSSIPSSAWVPVVVDDPEYDTNDCLNTVTGKYTPNVEGYYLVNVSAKIGGTGLIRGLSAIALNTTRVTQGSEAYNSTSPSEGITSTATSIVYCNGTTDYIQMQVLANGSTGSNSLLAGLGTQFNVSLISGQSSSGSGGKTVAFRGNLSANQVGLLSNEWTKVNLDTASVDTDSAFADGKFQPSVAGYYQVSGSLQSTSDGVSITSIGLYKTGIPYSYGTTGAFVQASRASMSDLIYLNGTTDYVELYSAAQSSATYDLSGSANFTYLSAVLVSGGSASGDSIWTEEDGVATYDGIVKSTAHFNATGDGTAGGIQFKDGNVLISRIDNDMILKADGADRMKLTADGVTTYQDMTVNGLTIGTGGLDNRNSAIGVSALQNATGSGNTALGYNAGTDLVGGSNCTIIGRGAQPSSPTVNNEVTIGNLDVTQTRLRGAVTIQGQLTVPNIQETSPGVPNCHIGPDGRFYQTAGTYYSTEEVDEKLAVKDKLIEKLSARLDELEKKVN